MGRVTVNVDVEVDLDDIDTEDLAEELESRGGKAVPPLSSEAPHPLHEIYYALKFGLDDKALGLMRAHINDELGTAL